MKWVDLIDSWLYGKRWSVLYRFLWFTALGLLVWCFSSNGIQKVLLWSCFLYSVFKAYGGAGRIWKNSAGIAFIAVLGYMVVTLPLSVSPKDAALDFIKLLDVLAAAYAISVLFNNERKISCALVYTASALTLVFACDLVRLFVYLGNNVFSKAHFFQPFLMSHPNNASIASGFAAFTLACFSWKWRGNRLQCLTCLGAMLINIFYIFVMASRGPQAAFAASIGLSGFIFLPGWRKKTLWLLAVCVAAVIVLGNLETVNPRFKDKKSMAGFCEREIVWKHTWSLSSNHPFIGHGYGKRIFQDVYYSSNPPRSRFFFPHPHSYWLYILFSHGWIGVVLYAVAWFLLIFRLLRQVVSQPAFEDIIVPGTVALLIIFIHVYVLVDWPSNIVYEMLVWLIPAALVVSDPNALVSR